jgi:diguanylate cyclase (GGDEF)-like protein/putative nucleotidyltransferase with HDIG domain
MAIDAKDQVTHGHIRRVQLFAVHLARSIGTRDEKLINAIEAAALLHDMGKLAVPEYILNKPGRLTPAEFDRMKLHASVGADILSAIDFPYPVVPIVRHHHENWDGSGYPDGLKGTEIPIGARILSVVDCYDALTSDRPYRPRLSDTDAVRILMERRGTMYDPLVVDTFVRVRNEIAPSLSEPGPSENALNQIAIARRTVAPPLADPIFSEIAASADEMLTLFELSRSLAPQLNFADSSDIITNHLRRLIPGTLYVFFALDASTGELEARHAVGRGTDVVRGLRIKIGQRLSGWVAAHRQTVSNSDPILDLGEAAHLPDGDLRSCISTPLQDDNDSIVGVLTIYAAHVDAFTDDHRRVLEAVSRQIAQTLRRATEFDASPKRDELTGLPTSRYLESLVPQSISVSDQPVALLLVDVFQLKRINSAHGRDTGDLVLRYVVSNLQRCIRVGDVVFRHSGDDFVVLLNGADRATAALVTRRMFESLVDHPLQLPNGKPLAIELVIGCAVTPNDGRSLVELLTAASQRQSSVPARKEPSIH